MATPRKPKPAAVVSQPTGVKQPFVHIVAFSGGHSSALTAIEVARRMRPLDRLILLNHDINARVEDADIKRFKNAVSAHLGVPITYANYADPNADQFDVAMKHSAFKLNHEQVVCTHRLKTEPFTAWLKQNIEAVGLQEETCVYYGFDASEPVRITRRSSILAAMGYRSDYPLALWRQRTIQSTREIGIEPPNTYNVFKHANCVGCIKGGVQHWYAVFCTRPDIWRKAKLAEEDIGYSIIKDYYLEDLEKRFETMRCAGVKPTEHESQQAFHAKAKKFIVLAEKNPDKPCECVF